MFSFLCESFVSITLKANVISSFKDLLSVLLCNWVLKSEMTVMLWKTQKRLMLNVVLTNMLCSYFFLPIRMMKYEVLLYLLLMVCLVSVVGMLILHRTGIYLQILLMLLQLFLDFILRFRFLFFFVSFSKVKSSNKLPIIVFQLHTFPAGFALDEQNEHSSSISDGASHSSFTICTSPTSSSVALGN